MISLCYKQTTQSKKIQFLLTSADQIHKKLEAIEHFMIQEVMDTKMLCIESLKMFDMIVSKCKQKCRIKKRLRWMTKEYDYYQFDL